MSISLTLCQILKYHIYHLLLFLAFPAFIVLANGSIMSISLKICQLHKFHPVLILFLTFSLQYHIICTSFLANILAINLKCVSYTTQLSNIKKKENIIFILFSIKKHLRRCWYKVATWHKLAAKFMILFAAFSPSNTVQCILYFVVEVEKRTSSQVDM